ncbi:energy transducer TonB [Acinetobacter sp. WCHAc060033]|nr:energy transducer TonB [Acinetobacter sp. WCHAc060033]
MQIPPPAKQQPEPKKTEPMVEEKVVNKPAFQKQKEMPAEAQQKTPKKFVESQSNKSVTTATKTAKKQSQQVVTEEQSTTTETKKVVESHAKTETSTQTKTQKTVEPKTQTQPESFDIKNYQPVSKIAPAYPESALDRKLEGDCTVVYSVNEKGRVENPKAQGDCHPMFVRPSIQAALAFKYQPRLVDGKPISVSNVKNTFQYRIES